MALENCRESALRVEEIHASTPPETPAAGSLKGAGAWSSWDCGERLPLGTGMQSGGKKRNLHVHATATALGGLGVPDYQALLPVGGGRGSVFSRKARHTRWGGALKFSIAYVFNNGRKWSLDTESRSVAD